MRSKLSFLPFTIVAVLFVLLNIYIYNPLNTLINSNYIYPIFWSVITAVVILFFFAIQRIQKHGIDGYFKFAAHLFIILIVSEIVTAFFLLVGDVLRVIRALINMAQTGHFNLADRNPIWVKIAFLLFLISVAVFIYGIIKGKYAYRVIKHTLYFDDLPEAFDGFTITQISDVHAGSFTKIKEVQKGIDLINEQKSDLFVFTGDLVNNLATEIKPYISIFSQIKAPYGQFSVLGNHDYGDYVKWPSEQQKADNLNDLKAQHKALGFRLLLDEHVKIKKNDQEITLLGIENWGLGFGERGDLDKALMHTESNDFKVLLSHDPSHWEAQTKNHHSKIQLTLAGHTHGMQFGIEAFGFKWSPVKYRYKHWAGIKTENGRVLNINRGFGFLGFSGRVGIWPEITVIELKKKK